MIRENCTMTRASSGTQAQDSVKKSCTRAPNFWSASRVSRKVNCNWPTYPSSPGFKSTLAIAIMIDLRRRRVEVRTFHVDHGKAVWLGTCVTSCTHGTQELQRPSCTALSTIPFDWDSPFGLDPKRVTAESFSFHPLQTSLSASKMTFPWSLLRMIFPWTPIFLKSWSNWLLTNLPPMSGTTWAIIIFVLFSRPTITGTLLSTKMIVGPPPSSFTSCRKFGQLIALPATHWGHQLAKGQCVSLWTRTCSVEGPFGRVLVWPSLTSVTSSSSSSWPYNPFSQLTAVLKLVVVLLLLRFTQHWWT